MKGSFDYLRAVQCPVCKKMFYPAPFHGYHDRRGRLVCTYPCSLADRERTEQCLAAADITLSIKRFWLDEILSGAKKEEYRDIKTYYRSRFRRIFGKEPDRCESERVARVRLRAGYSPLSPSAIIECTVRIGHGREEWGAEPGREYYILSIKKVEREVETK